MSSLPKESPKHLNVTFNDQEQIQVSFILKKSTYLMFTMLISQ